MSTSAPSDKIRWGIVGAGRIAHTFAQDMPATRSGVLQAVAARRGAHAQEFARQYNIATAHEGYEALYADPEVDAVYVATPHTFHVKNAGDALRAGKAVLCEKPLTVNARECRELIDVAMASSSYLMEAMWTWFLPSIRKACEWVNEGRIGTVMHIQAELGLTRRFDPSDRIYNKDLAGGSLLDIGIYPVALVDRFTGRLPDHITTIARHAPNGVDDHVVCTFDYGDCGATLASSFRAQLPNWAYIIGDEGYVAIPNFWRSTDCELWANEKRIECFHDDRTTNGFVYQIDAVNADLAHGKTESDTVPLSASLRFQTCMDRIRDQFPSA